MTTYADDTALSYVTDSIEGLRIHISEDLKALTYWFNRNSLSLNINKTKIIHFNLKPNENENLNSIAHSPTCILENCNCEVVESTSTIKYLGVILDSRLRWEEHIKNLKTQLFIACRKFYFLRYLCPNDVLKMLYFGTVESRLTYGVVAWGGTYFSIINPLMIGQKHIIRVMDKKPILHSSLAIFRSWNLLPLRYLYFFKMILRFGTERDTNLVIGQGRRQDLRSREMIIPPRPYKEIFRRFYLYVAPRIFNNLPAELKQLNNRQIFKKEVKSWLLLQNDVESFFSRQE